MSTTWEIEGEAGRALDGTRRFLGDLGEGFRLRLGEGVDTLSWTIVLEEIDGSTSLIPEEWQEVSLWRDGACVFRGTVGGVSPKLSGDSWTAEVSAWGAGGWLEREELNSLIPDDTEEDAERPQIEFSQGSLKSHIEGLLARAAAIGLPVAAGTIDDLYDAPRATLANMSFLMALADRLSHCPDAFGWWDYSVNPPEMNVSRRGSAPILSLDVDDENLVSVSLIPRPELEAQAATVHYAERLAGGGIALNNDSTEKTRATLTTAMSGTNNDLALRARRQGALGNDIAFAISGAFRDDLEVERIGKAVTIFRRTGGNTAVEVIDAINTAPPMFAMQRKTNTVGQPRDITVTAVEPGSAGNGVTLQFSQRAGVLAVDSVIGSVVTIGWNSSAYPNGRIAVREIIPLVEADAAASLLLTIESGLFDVNGLPAGAFDTGETFVTAGGNAGASALVYAENAPGSDGSGAVATLTSTNLAGGSDGVPPLPGRRTRTTISGPELVDYLPPDDLEYVKVRTGSLVSFQLFKDYDSRIREIIEEFGDFDLDEWSPPDTSYRGTEPITRTVLPGGVVNVPNYLRTNEFREWMHKLGSPRFQSVVRSGTYVYVVSPYTGYDDLTDQQKAIRDKSDWWVAIPGSPQVLRCYYELSAEVMGTDLNWTSARPIFKPGSYEFLKPPPDYAANLLAAQAWVPYEGTVTLVSEECDPASVLGRAVNIVGGLPEWTTMKALPATIDFALDSGQTSIRVGAPRRIGSGSLVRRVAGSPKANIVVA